MLCEMRGFDGSMSGWNGSHISADNSRGSCVFRKMEIGAYVVNSNQASRHNSYYQGENDSDMVFSHHESRHQGYPTSWHNELGASKLYVSQHLDKEQQKGQVERSVLRERHKPDYGSTSNHQLAMDDKHSGSQPQLPDAGGNYWISTQQEMETTKSADGSVTGNIYQGPIVRVQVPEVYYEGGSARGTETANRHNAAYNKDHERMGQHLPRTRETDEKYGSSPVSETYRRINEWLKNCQQHSTTSFKSSHASYGSNHSRTDIKPFSEKKLKQNTTLGNFSKSDYRMHSQTGSTSNLKVKPHEPQFVASLEPKVANTGNVMLQPNHHHRPQNTDWAEKREVPFRHDDQSSAPRNSDVTSAFSSNFNHMVNTTKRFYEKEANKTASEWSSETLSISGSDKSSYCTDFTPFELGPTDSSVRINQMSISANECPPSVGKNVLISHVMIDDRLQKKNVAHTKESSEALRDSVGNEFDRNRRNDQSKFNSGLNTNSGQKPKQQRLQDRFIDKIPKTHTDFEAPLQTSKTGRVVTVFIGDAQQAHQGAPQFGTITRQNNVGLRYEKATADPISSSQDVKNLKISDRNGIKGDRKSVQVPSETKLYTSDGRPMIPMRCTSLEQPLPPRYADKGQRFSIPTGNSGYKKSSGEDDSALRKQLESRSVPQLRSGSLSITIRPNRLTVMDYFKKIDDVWDSSGRKVEQVEPELKGTVTSSNIESPQEIGNDRVTDAKALDINDGLNSFSGDDVSDESEELDEFTKTVIKADISGKPLQSSSNTELSSKPQYNVLKQSKNLKPNASTLLADVHSRFAGTVYQTEEKNTESEDENNRDLKEQTMFQGHIPLNSISSFCGSQEQLQDYRPSMSWLPGKSTNSPDRELQMKLTKNNSLVDDSFGHNSEYSKCKYKDILKPDLKSSYENFTSNDIRTTNGSADRMAPAASDEFYADDRIHLETASPRSLPPASELGSDVSNNQLELESVQFRKEMSIANKSNEEDSLLMRLLQSQTPDLPEFESVCTPHLKSSNLAHTSDLTMQPFRSSSSNQFAKEAASKEVLKLSKTFYGRALQDEQPRSHHLKLLTSRNNESPKEGGRDLSEEFYQQKFQETEFSRKSLKDSPDSLLSVFVDGAATPAAVTRCLSRKSDSMTREEKDSERQGNNGCSKISEHYADDSFVIINNTMKNSEPMSCQEHIDFPENLLIDPPESFSDFTIVL